MQESFKLINLISKSAGLNRRPNKDGVALTTSFRPNGLPAWIGSLPVKDHAEAVRLMLAYTPDIPLWIQLPAFREEGMIRQFLSGLPGVKYEDNRVFVDSASDEFNAELVFFFEDYLAVTGGEKRLEDSRFALTPDAAPGFFAFTEALDNLEKPPVAVKGQVTGPFTFATGMNDENGRAVFYHDQLRDAAVKLIALKAGWQVRQMKRFGVPVILFLDEPALAGYGSSAYISISREEVDACLAEVIEAVHAEGGLAGVHVCANAEWSIILDSAADIVSFDAYSYFDKFILYADQIRTFMDKGGIVAWGIVPTGSLEAVDKADLESLADLWEAEVKQLEALGIERADIIAQSLITPSCGTGSLPLDHALKVIALTRELSERIRSKS